MGDKTGIKWTDATWNPVTGCSHVSAGCEHCYAETLSLRYGWSKKPWTAPNAAENVVLHPERLDQPLRWRKPRRIFVNSMSDLFHERVPLDFVSRVWATMAATPEHTYQILTKRPERMLTFLLAWVGGYSHDPALVLPEPWVRAPLSNVWCGVSIEQDRWTGRADILRQTPAAVRFISAEPLLEPLPSLSLAGIDWLIFGGESGPGARWMVRRCESETMELICHRCGGTGWEPKPWAREEARRLRDLAHAAGAAYFHKQWGGSTPKSAGNLLDGRTWEEFPAVAE